MKGLLKEKREIEKLIEEYQFLATLNFDLSKIELESSMYHEECVLEECEL